MDKIAVFSDIHANLLALEAVLEDMDARGIENRYCLGDLVGYGTFPNEVIDIVRGYEIPTVQGNYDQGVGNDSDDCGCAYRTDEARALGRRSIAWTNARVAAQNKAYLRGLHAQIPLKLGDLDVLLVHGSPRKINEYLFEDRRASSVERIFEQASVDVIICGHTHKPYHRIVSNGQIVNDGSVGKPKDGDPRACYAVITAAGSELSVEYVRVPYDVELAAQAIESSDMPDEFAGMLREARG